MQTRSHGTGSAARTICVRMHIIRIVATSFDCVQLCSAQNSSRSCLAKRQSAACVCVCARLRSIWEYKYPNLPPPAQLRGQWLSIQLHLRVCICMWFDNIAPSRVCVCVSTSGQTIYENTICEVVLRAATTNPTHYNVIVPPCWKSLASNSRAKTTLTSSSNSTKCRLLIVCLWRRWYDSEQFPVAWNLTHVPLLLTW